MTKLLDNALILVPYAALLVWTRRTLQLHMRAHPVRREELQYDRTLQSSAAEKTTHAPRRPLGPNAAAGRQLRPQQKWPVVPAGGGGGACDHTSLLFARMQAFLLLT